MRASIVIATYNRRRLLEATLPTVLGQDFDPRAFEVVVVVDGSTDDSLEWLRARSSACSLRVIASEHAGQAAAQNAGIRAARGDCVLFLDDDIHCAPSLLAAHVGTLEGHDRAYAFGPVLIDSRSAPGLGTEFARDYCDDYFENLSREREATGWQGTAGHANCSIPREWLSRCGGFDESLPYAFDAELALRLRRLGLTARYASEARAWQIFTKDARSLLEREAPMRGLADVELSRRYPEHRRRSSLGAISRGGPLKRWARKAAVQSPALSSAALRAVAAACEPVLRFAPARKLGLWAMRRQWAVRSLHAACGNCGSWDALDREFGRRLSVLLYHNVGEREDGEWPALTVSARAFERQMDWLARRGYVGIRPADWFAWISEGRALPDKPVLVTFDDAYESLADHAFPVLHRHGFGAGVFVVSDRIGGFNDWDVDRGYPRRALLGPAHIRDWSARGIEFGSHARTHRGLGALSEAELTAEVASSSDPIAELAAVPVRSFAYPYGEVDARVRDAVSAHYDLAFVMRGGMNSLLSDPHLLSRTVVQPGDTLADFACRVAFGASPLDGVRRRLSRSKRRVGTRAAPVF